MIKKKFDKKIKIIGPSNNRFKELSINKNHYLFNLFFKNWFSKKKTILFSFQSNIFDLICKSIQAQNNIKNQCFSRCLFKNDLKDFS